MSLHTSAVNAVGALDTSTGVDLADRTEDSNALLTLTKNSGPLRGSVTVGAYSFPTVGEAVSPTTQQGANATLFGTVPLAYLAYSVNPHLTLSAGKQMTLLGQESAFTYQNVNIERGIGFALEPTISRGLRATYTQGKLTADIEVNDGFYAGNAGRALEGLIGWSASPNTSVQLAVILPGRNTPGNATAAIANKAEVDLMLTRQIGKLQVLPYVLLVDSPASMRLGYATSERASAFALIADYAFTPTYAVALRVETAADASARSDRSTNADLLGYGPGSGASEWTITPSYHPGPFFARGEVSEVALRGFTPGLAFGASGGSAMQRRYLIELGVQF